MVDANHEDWSSRDYLQESIILANEFWLPDTEILGLKTIKSLEVTRTIGGFVVYKNKTLELSKKWDLCNIFTSSIFYNQHLEFPYKLHV